MPPSVPAGDEQSKPVDSGTLHEHLRERRLHSRVEERYWKVLEIPNRVRSALLVNRWLPWSVYVPYLAYEALLRHSPGLRDRWSEQRRNKPRRKMNKLPQTLPYQRLRFEDSIRLLHLLPGEHEDPIRCSVTHHRLSEQPHYTAISYSWNDNMGSKPTTVKCGIHEIVVQNTIFQLLKRLRTLDEHVVLWIDAVCINQTDNIEKGHQVAMMGQIYSSAALVVVWVGESDDRMARTARFFDQMASRRESADGTGDNALWRLGLEWTDLAVFLERPWFTRTWVLQEVCFARSCLLRCGPYSWPWDTLQKVFDNLLALGTGDVPGAVRRLNRGVIGFSRNWKRWSGALDQGGGYYLASLLTATRGTFATVPADKVYALLSMSDDHFGIHADYDKPAQDVFKDVARKLMKDQAPIVLAVASDNVWNDTTGLPTWVPDWACMGKPTSLPVSRQRDLNSVSDMLRKEEEVASGPTVSVAGRLLHLSIFELDRVNATGVPWPGNGQEQNPSIPEIPLWEIGTFGVTRLEQWHRMLPLFVQGDRCTYAPTGEHRSGAFMRTIVADSTILPTCCLTWEAVYLVFRDRLRWLQRTTAADFHSAFWQIEDVMVDYHDAVKAMCHKRTLFFTKSGYMGLGPFNTLPFDRICVVPGLYPPVVMRKTLKGRYKLIGECYLHGWTRPDNVSALATIETIQ